MTKRITRPTAIAADYVAIAVFALLARAAHQSDDMPFNFTAVSYTHLTLPTSDLV